MRRVVALGKKAYQDERGANMIITLAIAFGLLLLVPIFVDFASLHFSHRMAQTGADTAAHAAAVEFSYYWIESSLPGNPGNLSGRFWSDCRIDPDGREAAKEYLDTVVRPTAELLTWQGWAAAASYASQHRATLERYNQWYGSHTNEETAIDDTGVVIKAIEIYAKTRHPTPIIYDQLYGEGYQTPAEATAELYLDDYSHWAEPCGPDGEEIHYFEFFWKVRLIDTVRF